MIEKGVFTFLATVSLILGVIELFAGLFSWNIVVLLSAIFTLICSYAWSQVGEICDAVGYLEREVSKLK